MYIKIVSVTFQKYPCFYIASYIVIPLKLKEGEISMKTSPNGSTKRVCSVTFHQFYHIFYFKRVLELMPKGVVWFLNVHIIYMSN